MPKAIGKPDRHTEKWNDTSVNLKSMENKMSENSENKNVDKVSELAEKKQASIVTEFWFFLKHCKKWWLLPIIIILLLLGALIILTESSAVAPFIYTLF